MSAPALSSADSNVKAAKPGRIMTLIHYLPCGDTVSIHRCFVFQLRVPLRVLAAAKCIPVVTAKHFAHVSVAVGRLSVPWSWLPSPTAYYILWRWFIGWMCGQLHGFPAAKFPALSWLHSQSLRSAYNTTPLISYPFNLADCVQPSEWCGVLGQAHPHHPWPTCDFRVDC
jgi:hypothetical protein